MSLFGFDRAVPTAYLPRPGSVDRLSVASWLRGPDDPAPVFGGDPAGPTVVVVWWQTDPAGYVLHGSGSAAVVFWQLSSDLFRSLSAIHQDFHLGRHDLLVRGERGLAPCAESLLRHRYGRDDGSLRHSIDVAVQELSRLRAPPVLTGSGA